MAGEALLAFTPTWAVATVITAMVSLGFFFQSSLKQFGKWLCENKRTTLLSALEKIKDELMLFGLLSLMMGHWIVYVAKICVQTSSLSRRFYPCAVKDQLRSAEHILISALHFQNSSAVSEQVTSTPPDYCPKGLESFASHETLEQLHRLIFVLAIIHVCYSFVAVSLAMTKIYGWRTWENQAKSMAIQSIQCVKLNLTSLQGLPENGTGDRRMTRFSSFVFQSTAHSWSQQKSLVWLLCFIRQFWGSVNQADYMALRFSFISKHQLPLTYDFHSYILRSMEEEFHDVVGISVPLWIYAICCIVLDFHGTDVYFWLSFLPLLLIVLIGTKLQEVVVKLAIEIQDTYPKVRNHQVNPKDGLFCCGKPRLLLRVVQFITFQNAFEMASLVWSLWEIRDSSCFMDNHRYIAVRLTFGLVTQFWSSFITFPLYVIVTQMGARFNKAIVSETVRISLQGWQRRARARTSSNSPSPLPSTGAPTTPSSHFTMDSTNYTEDSVTGGQPESEDASRKLVHVYKMLQEERCSSAVDSGEVSGKNSTEIVEEVALSDFDTNHDHDNSGDEDDVRRQS